MSCASGPSIVTTGLVLYVDADNSAESAKGMQNILDLSTWTLGAGGTSNFAANGTTAENQRILDTGPFGVSTVVWDTPSNDATSDADGGWNTGLIPIDPTKLYRFSTWIRRKTIGDGVYYLGTYGYNASNVNEGVLTRSTGAVNTNLYFSASTWPVSILANEWMLVVGHVWPAGSGIGSDNPDSGLWNTAGTKFSAATSSGDAVWQTTNTQTIHRSYLYYSTVTTTNQQWYQPRIDLCDGTQPSIAELIAGVGSNWYDVSGPNYGNILNTECLYNSAGYMTFDGIDDLVAFPNSTALDTQTFTIEVWVKTNNTTQNGFWFEKGVVNSQYSLFQEGTNIVCRVNTGTVVNVVTATTATYMNTTQWYQVVFTFTSGSQVLYINGVVVNTGITTGTVATNNGGMSIGAYGGQIGSHSYYYNGSVSIAKVYNRALSAAEVQQNFNALRGRFGI